MILCCFFFKEKETATVQIKVKNNQDVTNKFIIYQIWKSEPPLYRMRLFNLCFISDLGHLFLRSQGEKRFGSLCI